MSVRRVLFAFFIPLLGFVPAISCSSSREAQPAESAVQLSPLEALGKELFFDRGLSTPAGQACADCHAPDAGFSNPEQDLPVSQGVHADRFGGRNDLTAAYASYVPPLHYDESQGGYAGGLFWDGRAADLVAQAQGPPLNPLEMANPGVTAVVESLRRASYAEQFRAVFGKDSLDNPEQAFRYMAEAIAAWESSPEVNQFSSKYDLYLQGKAELSESELRGLALFENPEKGNCASCHPSRPSADGTPPLFSDHTYDNLGVPRNPENPFYFLSPDLNPEGLDWIDLGLGAVVNKPEENGKFRVPTLRNVAESGPYMHNGLFKTLHQVVAFYNTRDVAGWPAPEVAENLNDAELGDLGLSQQEVLDIVEFLRTLSDGYAENADSGESR
jgi:cytochrome c peroxidase